MLVAAGQVACFKGHIPFGSASPPGEERLRRGCVRGRVGGPAADCPRARRARHTSAQCLPWMSARVHAAKHTRFMLTTAGYVTVDATLTCATVRSGMVSASTGKDND